MANKPTLTVNYEPDGAGNVLKQTVSSPDFTDYVYDGGRLRSEQSTGQGTPTPFRFARLAEDVARGGKLLGAVKQADETAGGVYSLRDEAGNVVRTGRTNNLARREREHFRSPELSEYQFRAEYLTDDYATQRGLEQLLHEEFLPALNKINPISATNPRRLEYTRAGRSFLDGR